jgi:hypothetical protein
MPKIFSPQTLSNQLVLASFNVLVVVGQFKTHCWSAYVRKIFRRLMIDPDSSLPRKRFHFRELRLSISRPAAVRKSDLRSAGRAKKNPPVISSFSIHS